MHAHPTGSLPAPGRGRPLTLLRFVLLREFRPRTSAAGGAPADGEPVVPEMETAR